jgi:hypothetical protein
MISKGPVSVILSRTGDSSVVPSNQVNDGVYYLNDAMSPWFDGMKNIIILEVALAHLDIVILGHGPMLMLFQAACCFSRLQQLSSTGLQLRNVSVRPSVT